MSQGKFQGQLCHRLHARGQSRGNHHIAQGVFDEIREAIGLNDIIFWPISGGDPPPALLRVGTHWPLHSKLRHITNIYNTKLSSMAGLVDCSNDVSTPLRGGRAEVQNHYWSALWNISHRAYFPAYPISKPHAGPLPLNVYDIIDILAT